MVEWCTSVTVLRKILSWTGIFIAWHLPHEHQSGVDLCWLHLRRASVATLPRAECLHVKCVCLRRG